MASIDGNKIIDQIKEKRDRTAKNSGTISTNGKVLASVQDSTPTVGNTQSEPMTNNQKFLKQIEDYNDFIVQNDLDAEQIDPSNDYDFSAFTSPEDWAIESDRLADRLSDRKIEIKQNENAGEFANMELEGGVPSYEAVKSMSDEEFSSYEKKYLLGDTSQSQSTESAPKKTVSTATIPRDVATVSADTIPTTVSATSTEPPAHKTSKIPADVGSRVQGEDWSIFSADGARDFVVDGLGSFFRGREDGRDRRYVPKDLYIKNLEREKRAQLDASHNKQEAKDKNRADDITAVRNLKRKNQIKPEQSTFEKVERIAVNSLPMPMKYGYNSAKDTINSGIKLKDEVHRHGIANAASDVGTGFMARLAQPFDSKSSRWWKNKQNLQNSEASNLGTNIADEAMMGLGGGLLGRTVGTGYRSMKRGGEMLRHSAVKAGKARQELANDHIDYGHKFLTGIGMPSNIAKGKISAKDAEGTGHRVYENITKPLKRKPYGGSESLGSTLTHNIRRKVDSRAMLQRNDDEINSLFNQGKTLKQAKSHQKKHWESQPNQYQQIGAVMGGGLGLSGNSGL